MSDRFEYGPPQQYQVIWQSGHVETVPGHQITWPGSATDMFAHFGGIAQQTERVRWLNIHAEIDGRWTLVLAAREADITSVRCLTAAPEPT